MANYTVKAIMQNFEEMLVEMPFSKVTVSALVERCEISSNTFYYHFRDIYELLDQWVSLQIGKYLDWGQENPDWAKDLTNLLKAMQAKPVMIYHIWNAITKERLEQFVFGPVQDGFYRIVKKRLADVDVSDDFVKTVSDFCCYSTLGFVLKFLWDQMKADVDESVERLSKILLGTIDSMVARETEQVKLKKE